MGFRVESSENKKSGFRVEVPEEEIVSSPKKKTLEEQLFPTATEEAKKPLSPLMVGKTAGKLALDIAGIPTRAAAALTGQDFSDPTAYALKPLVEKISPKIEEMFPENGGVPLQPGAMPTPFTPSSKTVKGIAEIAGGTLSDPFLLPGLAKNIAGRAAKGLGKRIESSVLGKGAKSVLRDQGVTLDKAVTGALENKMGGNMAQTLERGNEIIQGIEDKISNLTKNYNGPKQVNIEYQFYKARKYVEDHPELFLTDRKAVESAIDDLEKNFDSFGLTGNVPVDKAQELKRSLKVKGIPSQNSPAQQDAVFGLKMAFADAIRDIIPEIQIYNDKYRKILPALKIAANRLPVEQSRDIIGLGTFGALGIGGLLSGGSALPAIAINALYQGSKSGTMAQGLYNAGKGIESIPFPIPYGGASVGTRSILEKK